MSVRGPAPGSRARTTGVAGKLRSNSTSQPTSPSAVANRSETSRVSPVGLSIRTRSSASWASRSALMRESASSNSVIVILFIRPADEEGPVAVIEHLQDSLGQRLRVVADDLRLINEVPLDGPVAH